MVGRVKQKFLSPPPDPINQWKVNQEFRKGGR